MSKNSVFYALFSAMSFPIIYFERKLLQCQNHLKIRKIQLESVNPKYIDRMI